MAEITLSCGRVVIQDKDPRFPLGGRGERPVRFFLSWDDADFIKSLRIPGVIVNSTRCDVAWDKALAVSTHLGCRDELYPEYQRRATQKLPFINGMARYKASKIATMRRDYQAESIQFLIRRAYAILGELPRLGKCLMILGTHVITESRRTLIICNSLGLRVWAAEIAKWIDGKTAILYGRGGDEVRVFCNTCEGRGKLRQDSTDAEGESVTTWRKCPECIGRNGQSYGERIYRARKLEVVEDSRVYFEDTGKLKKDGSPKLQRRTARFTPLPVKFYCPSHPDEIDDHERTCRQCKKEMMTALMECEFVVVSFDILIAQSETDDRGVITVREDLPGWGPTLAQLQFDYAVTSECHHLKTCHVSRDRKGFARVDRVYDIVEPIPRVHAESGTPSQGYVRDYYQILNIISRGLWS